MKNIIAIVLMCALFFVLVNTNTAQHSGESLVLSVSDTISFVTITETYTAFIADDGSDKILGTLRLRAVVLHESGENVTDCGDFDFLWQFRSDDGDEWADTGTGTSLIVQDARISGFYRCVITYDGEGEGIGGNVIYTDEVEVVYYPNTTPYFAVISENGNSNSGTVNLRAFVYDINGERITNLSDFRFQWEFSERQEVIINGNLTYTYTAFRSVTEMSESPFFLQSNATITGVYRCAVTYIGEGEARDNDNVFYTGEAYWSVMVTNTTMSSAISSVTGTNIPTLTTGGDPGRFRGLTITVDGGVFNIRIINQSGMSCTYVYKFRLYNVVNGEKIEPPLEVPVGGNITTIPGRRLSDPVPEGFTTANGSGASDPIPIGIVANGINDYILEYNLTRRVADNQMNNHSWNVRGEISFSTRGTVQQSEVSEIVTTTTPSSSYDIYIDGAGEPINVDYPTYEPTDTDAIVSLDVAFRAHIISYEPNAGSGLMHDSIIRRNRDYSIKANAFTRAYYGFTGWNTEADGSGEFYAALSVITNVNDDIVLYAQWSQDNFTVTFNPNGGDVEPNEAITGLDGRLESFPVPVNGQLIFDGWFTQLTGGELLTADTVFSGDTTVFARWRTTLSFTDSSGEVGMTYVFLPADTDESRILNGENLKVFFKLSENAAPDDVTFLFGGNDATRGNIYSSEVQGVFYFYLNPGLIAVLESQSAVTIQAAISGGDPQNITVRKIGLFNLV
jgi:uncharacterized repeat protein (TIGR02543 family)